MSYCTELGFSLENIVSANIPFVSKLNIGAVLEIFSFGKSKKLEYSKIVSIIGAMTKTASINVDACISKIHRVVAADKKKRGIHRNTYRLEEFLIPTLKPVQAEQESANVTKGDDVEIDVLKIKLEQKKDQVLHLKEEKKQLKRKLERRDTKLTKTLSAKKTKLQPEKLRGETQKYKQLVEKNQDMLQKAREKSKKQYWSIIDANRKIKLLDNRVKGSSNELSTLKEQFKVIQAENDSLQKENETLQKGQQERDISLSYLHGLLQEEADLIVYDHNKHMYTNELVNCAINLTDLKVATKNVGKVISEVSSLCGRIPNKLPSRQVVDNFVDTKLVLAQKQLGTVLETSADTSLYTDETRKYGHTYQTYVITDKDQNSYLLGLREMLNKSGQCALDTMKDILQDITDHCEHMEETEEATVGNKILRNICNTMSDRASTEKHFNDLLQRYRHEILPDVVQSYERMSEEEQVLCGQMNNFFCGLHLLVGLADVTEATLKKFETSYLADKLIGSAARPELRRYHKSESGTLRLLRTSSKSFAMGEDEKNGVFLPWKVFLTSKGETKNHIQRFKHNRFNMVFLIGQAVYYHHEDIFTFLDNVHGTANDLLKAVVLDVQENLYIAGAKSLGLISKFVTAPLWRIIEKPGHILDMNAHYDSLVKFLEKASTDPETTLLFMKGQNSPFETILNDDDKVLSKLLLENEPIDEIVLPILQSVFLSMKEMLLRMIPEHLPQGKFWEVSEEMREQTKSVKRHNKGPEFIFGQLDHLVSFRPNATVLANEAYLMYSFNKTSKWLADLKEEERSAMLESSRKEGAKVRKLFKERLKELEEKRRVVQKAKQKELERMEKERIKKAENITKGVCYYGLWQSAQQMNEALERLKDDEKEIISALHAQLRFRKTVLRQKHSNNKMFNLSRKKPDGKYEKLKATDLKQNILELIHSAGRTVTTEIKQGDVPLLVEKKISHTFTDGDYTGQVIGVVPGFPEWYNVKYEGDDAVYAYNLLEDYRKGDVRIIV